VSLLLHPRAIGREPLLWRDWSRRVYRRACIQVVRTQRREVELHPSLASPLAPPPASLSRAQRAHSRLTFQERLARNGRSPTARPVTITIFGVPGAFAVFLGLRSAYARDLLRFFLLREGSCSERSASCLFPGIPFVPLLFSFFTPPSLFQTPVSLDFSLIISP
jgi:hypothetical protein